MLRELRVPGPTPLPPQVQEALARPMINHRGREFRELHQQVRAKLQQVTGLPHEVFLLTASGTGGLEAAICNCIRPGDRVLALVTGHFGQRFAAIARRYGALVECLRFPPGQAVDQAAVSLELDRAHYDAVLLTHCETSTGVLNDVGAISRLIAARPKPPALLVDAVSSLGAVRIEADPLPDIIVTASQKAWMTPPGLSMVFVSSEIWPRIEANPSPRYYLDLVAARRYGERGETPWTPALPLIYGLDAALDLILAEGSTAFCDRHQRLARRLRAGLRSLGLVILPAEKDASPTVTAAWLPQGVQYDAFAAELRERFGVELAGGQDELKNRIFRIGHMGYIYEENVEYLLSAIGDVLHTGARGKE